MHHFGQDEQATLESLFRIGPDISTNLGAVFFGNTFPSLSVTTENMMMVLTEGLVDNFHRFKVDGQNSFGFGQFSMECFVEKLEELLSLKEGDSKGREVRKKGKGGKAPRVQLAEKQMDKLKKRRVTRAATKELAKFESRLEEARKEARGHKRKREEE